ncbi:dihydropteroate synthase [Rhizobium sp. SG_E_25_P2]|uniref:dihydropteroate synthase n=1 Tax=Rhizobium sp. SG_E_25_P2 TaxID=2879942 RepID=UPI0024768126|nr:dihydropteroate synthase [Rhizobium sp. SG_E_25_P2]MDH6268013.1 dihydropteroate synthase [Rhizobium sp. SG_E_25_P2]
MTSPFAPFDWTLAHGRSLRLGPEAVIMAVINVTPDSFSDGGRNLAVESAVANARQAVEDGAGIIDIGGESTRPGAAPVSALEEQARILPVIAELARSTDAILSVDTYRADTARLAIMAGAHIINDIEGLQKDPDMAAAAVDTGAGVVAMHTGRGREKLADPIEDQRLFFDATLEIAQAAGLDRERLVLDPGFGFNKETPADNLALMSRFDELIALGYPLLAGTSRKRFLGALTDRAPAERDVATAATSALLRISGAAIFRVHNVAFNRDALRVADAMLKARETDGRGTLA